MDALVVRYTVKNSSGIVLQDTQNSLNNKFYSIRTFPQENIVAFYYPGTNCGVGYGTVFLSRINANQFSWVYRPEGSIFVNKDEECPGNPDTKVYLPVTDTSDYCYMPWDSKYNVTYKIEQEFGDHFPDSTITFTAYDHDFSHRFLFEDYNVNVLLFVEERCGELIHKRYKFYPVYKTADGRWATPVETDRSGYDKFEDLYDNIIFDKSVSFDIPDDLSDEQMAQFIKH